MNKNVTNNNSRGNPNEMLSLGLCDFDNIPIDNKNKNIVKNVRNEIMNEAVKWCEENIKGFNVSVNTDELGNIIITGDCYIDNPNLVELPYKIHKVDGNFSVCGDATIPRVMNLKSLKNFPRIVTGNFKINLNHGLTSLEGGPVEVGGYYNCAHCNLKTLDGIAKKIGQYIVAYKNPLENIDILSDIEFSNIDLEYCDNIYESAVYKQLVNMKKVYVNFLQAEYNS